MCIRIVKTLWKGFFKTLKSNFAKNQVQMDPFISYDVEFSSFIGQNRRQFTHCNDKRHLRHVFGYEIVVIKLYFWDRGYFMTLNQEAEGIWIWHQCHLKLDRVTKDRKEDRFQCDLKSFYRTHAMLKQTEVKLTTTGSGQLLPLE